MKSVLKILFRQPWHLWRQFPLITRLQHLFLLLVLYAYTVRQLHRFLVNASLVSHFEITHLVFAGSFGFILYFLASSPLIFNRLLPRQKALQTLQLLPLSKSQALAITFYYVHKFWFIPWAINIAFVAALIWATPVWGVIFLVHIILWDLAIFIFSFRYFGGKSSSLAYYLFALSIALGLGILSFFFWDRPYLLAAGAGLLGLGFLLVEFFRLQSRPVHEEQFFSLQSNVFRKPKTYIAKKMAGPFRALFLKDYLGMQRNRRYLKSQGLLWSALVLSGLLVFHAFPQKAVEIFTLILGLFLWYHYGSFFSSRFAQEEPEWFFRLTPIPFVRFVLARFLAEFIFAAIMLFSYALVLWGMGLPPEAYWQLLLALTLLSIIALLTMIAFQIIFFDNRRAAGYAYHFSLLFFTIMSLNYYFVGPLLTVTFLIIYFYKSYRFLAQ